MAPHLRGEHDPFFDHEPAREESLQGREELILGQRREEAEAAEVHAENRHAQVAHEPRHGEKRAVAAQHQQQVHLRRQVGLACRGRLRVRAQPRRLLLEDRLESMLDAPGEQSLNDLAGIGPIGLGDDADSLHAETLFMQALRIPPLGR